MSLSGKWEGKLLDTSGVISLLDLQLNERDGKIEGEFRAYFLSTDANGCCGPTKRLVQIAPVAGEFDKKNDQVYLNYELKLGDRSFAVSFEGDLVKADPHALRAIRGCYRIEESSERLGLEGGACVLWLYATPENKELIRGN